MLEVWVNLAPLIIASAALPLQTIITLRLVNSSLAAAFAWVAGMTAVRLVQGFLFGFALSRIEERSGYDSPRFVLGGLLLVLAVLLYLKALREMLGADEEDAPSPKWLAKVGSMPPLAAFGAGANIHDNQC